MVTTITTRNGTLKIKATIHQQIKDMDITMAKHNISQAIFRERFDTKSPATDKGEFISNEKYTGKNRSNAKSLPDGKNSTFNTKSTSEPNTDGSISEPNGNANSANEPSHSTDPRIRIGTLSNKLKIFFLLIQIIQNSGK